MPKQHLERVLVWSGWLRLSHLLLAVSVLVLMATGWLMRNAPSVEAGAVDVHYYAASLLVVGLVLRIWLLFTGRPVERWSQLMPEDDEWPAIREMLRFYLSLSRAPLPRWYAHNPLWKALYLLLLLLLIVLAFTGGMMGGHALLFGVYLPDVHRVFSAAVWIWVAAHAITVLLHDWRGQADDVSAMLHGHRLFFIDRSPLEGAEIHETVVRLDQIGRPPKGEE